jgi:thiosulfate/3-mercaptopyruvate sulfurtransferase
MRIPLPLVAAAAVLAGFSASAQPLVGPDWLTAHRADPHVVVLDIRPADVEGAGHVPGAVSADYEKAGWRVKQADGAGGALPPIDRIAATISGLGVGDADRAVIVSEDFGAAARVYWTFKVLGHSDVSILDGGWKAWLAAGQPVQTDPVAPHPAVFTPHYDATVRAALPDVAEAVATGDATLVDARPPAQWRGQAKTAVVQAYGHLPGAVWIDQTETLSADGSRLKPRAELAALFARLGDRPVTTYCNTGHLAATDWFVLSEVLHHPRTRLYDASMSQWAADPARPVVK